MPAICVNKARHSLDLQLSFYDNSKEVSKLNDVFAFNAFRIKKRLIMRKKRLVQKVDRGLRGNLDGAGSSYKTSDKL